MTPAEVLKQITYYCENPDGTTTIEFVRTSRLARFVRAHIKAQRVSNVRIAQCLRDLKRASCSCK